MFKILHKWFVNSGSLKIWISDAAENTMMEIMEEGYIYPHKKGKSTPSKEQFFRDFTQILYDLNLVVRQLSFQPMLFSY